MGFIYKKRELLLPSTFQKIFRIRRKENFLIELENLLSENEENLLNITNEEIANLKRKYKVSQDDYKKEREEYYDLYLCECLKDGLLKDEEEESLDYLRFLLDISEEYARNRMEEELDKL